MFSGLKRQRFLKLNKIKYFTYEFEEATNF